MSKKRTYLFAFRLALYLSIFCLAITLITSSFFLEKTRVLFAITIGIVVFVFTFFMVQVMVERFIYRRVKAIYNEVSVLNLEDLIKNNITSDMETLSQEVKKFAEDKRLEIEMLKIREKYRREYLGNISHELKTPLFTVQGYLLTLLEGGVKDKMMRDKYLERANKGVERLINVVKDLDMIAKLESGNLNPKFETFNIVAVIQNVFDLLEIKAAKKSISLSYNKAYDTPILVNADLKRIEQVLINLVENSIKYGKQKGRTVVSIKNYSAHQISVEIADDGEGIAERHLSRLFERFYRVEPSRARDQGGSGLGLSIVKHILEAHQQEVKVSSDLGKGCTFLFTLEKVE